MLQGCAQKGCESRVNPSGRKEQVPMHDFTDTELERYSRNILLSEIGIEGQEKLLSARVLVIGAGGLGSPVALYLAAAGIGTIGIADGDIVDLTNLQRQIIHATADIGRSKTDSAQEKLLAINPGIAIKTIPYFLTEENITQTIRDYDFIVDCTDSFAAKFLINDTCVAERKPFSHGGILHFTGQTMTILPNHSACYRCIFREPPPAGSVAVCSEAGVLGAVAGIVGSVQATEVVKYLTGSGELLTDRLLSFDALTMHFRTVNVRRQTNCPCCGHKREVGPEQYLSPPCALR